MTKAKYAVFVFCGLAFATVAKAGVCPGNQQANGTCNSAVGENCTDGYACYKDVCCPGCQTRLRQQNSNRNLPGAYLPQCDQTGLYLSEQCHYSAGLCWCVTELGEEIPNTRVTADVTVRGRRECDLERQRYNESADGLQEQSSMLPGANESSLSGPLELTTALSVQTQTPLYIMIGATTTTTTQPPLITRAMNPAQDRPGSCPPVKPGQLGPCLTRCLRDTDCPMADFKCCSNGCGKECKPAANEGQESSEANHTSTSTQDATIVDVPGLDNETCGPNTVVSPCASPCPIGCDELSGPACTPTGCETGCECAPGFVRSRANDTSSPCVELTTCQPSNATVPLPSKICNDSNALWSDCGTACEETCHSKPTGCKIQCTPGCFCRSDFVKESNDTNARCILKSQCPRSDLMARPKEQCDDPNAFWSNCGSACLETCQAGLPDICRTLPCVSGCFCKSGYVKELNDPKSKCIPKSDCNLAVIQPGIVQMQVQCPDSNSVFLSCGTACEETCQYRPAACTKQCVPGCFCRPGYVKESSNAGALCVTRSRCSALVRPPFQQQRCQDPNAVFQTCGTACQETCDYRPTVCFMPCISGCFCREGFVKESGLPTSRCVMKSQCGQILPPQQSRCPDPNARWSNCGTACPQTCQQLTPQMCTRQCIPGCFCNDGFVKESSAPNARCVLVSRCGSVQPQPSCSDPNANWQSCGSACQETCQFRPTICTLQCVSGCFCNDGFVRENSSPNARCVARGACSNQQQQPRPKPGFCPPFNPNPYFGRPSRQDQCGSDNDCQTVLKCCNSLTGFVCMAPAGSEGSFVPIVVTARVAVVDEGQEA